VNYAVEKNVIPKGELAPAASIETSVQDGLFLFTRVIINTRKFFNAGHKGVPDEKENQKVRSLRKRCR
jgi:hypothetical protein